MILFNFPMLSIANLDGNINGIPILYFYVFSLWIIFIVIIYWNVRNEEQDNKKDE